MLIANPIYDTVFKFLMQDLDVAKGIISAIIGKEIDFINFGAQENVYYDKEKKYTFYHLDFLAHIRQKEGGYKKVLVEMQKTNRQYDIHRFRRYVGDQYKKETEMVADNHRVERKPVPIIAVFFLGFYLSKTLPPVIKVNREYTDLLYGTEIREKNDFIECLSHDSYVIQVPGLKSQVKNRLEYIFSVFKQENFVTTEQYVKGYHHETEDPLMVKILCRLQKATADPEVWRQCELEEMAAHEYEATVGKFERQLVEKEHLLREKMEVISNQTRVIQDNIGILHTNKETIKQNEKTIKESKKAIKAHKGTIKKHEMTIKEQDDALRANQERIEALLKERSRLQKQMEKKTAE